MLGIGVVLKRYVKNSSDFFLAGRSLPAWICGLAFLSANLGAQEVSECAASGRSTAVMTAHFYWIGAVPAMVFVGVFMMPFYYGSRARSVPEYLKLRFDEKTRGVERDHICGDDHLLVRHQDVCAWAAVPAGLGGVSRIEALLSRRPIVLIYIFLGGLTSAIYNEVLQFFLIVLGFLPLRPFSGRRTLAGGVELQTSLHCRRNRRIPGKYVAHASDNPMGVEAFGLVMRAWVCALVRLLVYGFSGDSARHGGRPMCTGRRTPLIAAFPKIFMPFVVDPAGHGRGRTTKMCAQAGRISLPQRLKRITITA